MPAAVEHIWLWWHELHALRRSNGWGAEGLTWADVDAWARLTAAWPRPAEIRALLMLDREWMAAEAARREAARKRAEGRR